MEYRFQEDVVLVQEILGLGRRELAAQIGIGVATLERWIKGSTQPSRQGLVRFYDFAFKSGIPLNKIKAQLRQEELSRTDYRLLFHGSKRGIQEPLRVDASRSTNDFGRGFYCGESLARSAMFVNHYDDSSIYLVAFASDKFQELRFGVDQDWLLTVSAFRGRLQEYEGSARIQKLREKVAKADYIVAPIADNRMFEIMDEFSQGLITDEQCQHALSATGLGMQWVITSPRALASVVLLEKCFLCPRERVHYDDMRKDELSVGLTKVKAARRQYRGKGRYVDEILEGSE